MTDFRTIREIHDAYDAGRTTPVELTRAYLDRVKSSDLNAYLTICEDRALGQANAAEAILRSSDGKVPREKMPLLGIPVGIKDVFTVSGVRTTCGSKVLENYIAPYTATCVDRLEAAGAISLGKLNMDEFAMGSSNENSAFGPARHPTHPDRVPGGSSGGSGAAVRGGLCVGALGTDTGGSIRLPASYCGVVGLKPTYGRVSRYGLVAFASSLDQCGPMTNSVEDAARLLEVMAGHDPLDSTSAPVLTGEWTRGLEQGVDWSSLRIGIPDEYMLGGLSADVTARVRDAIDWFRKRGAKLVPVSLPHTKYAIATYYIVAVSEASSNLARFDGVRYGVRPNEAIESSDLTEFYKAVRANFGNEVKRRIILGTFALSSGYYDAYYRQACQARRLVRKDFDEAFEKVDLILSPVAPTTAFRVGEKSSDPLQMYLVDTFTIPAILAGLPAMSLPCGEDSDGLSVGLQLIAPHFAEERLFNIGHAFERR